MKLIVTLELDVPEGATPEQAEDAVKEVLRNPLEINGDMVYNWASTSSKVENA